MFDSERFEKIKRLSRDSSAAARATLYSLLEEDITEASERGWGMPETMLALVYLIAKQGIAEDVGLIWRAKIANMDTFSGVDVQLLTGAGVAETKRYLAEHPELNELGTVTINGRTFTLSAYFRACEEAGDFAIRDGIFVSVAAEVED